jgi:hypothetical protein
MNDGYLQRLFDRVAAHNSPTPPVVPSGVSTSPMAMADQRLNDPDLAGDFSFGSTALDGLQEGLSEPVPASWPLVMARPLSREALTQTLDQSESPSVADDAAPGRAALPPPAADQPPDFTIPGVGQVFESDFVQPEIEEASPEPASPAVATPALQAKPPESPLPPPAPVDEPVPPSIPAIDYSAVEPQLADAVPAPELSSDGDQPSYEPGHRLPESSDMGLPEAVVVERKRGVESLPVEPAVVQPVTANESQPAVEVLPPPIILEPLPAINEAPAPVPEPPASTQTTTVVEKEVEPQPVPAPPRQVRPMTASEASVIGPLRRRPRAVTLFGVRRR